MNAALMGFLPGALIGLGLAVFVVLYAPRTIQSADALGRLGAVAVFDDEVTIGKGRDERIGGWIHRHMPNVPLLLPPMKQLDLLEVSVSTYYATKLVYAIAGLVSPLLISISFQLLGLPAIFPLILSPVFALILWFAPDSMYRAKARQRQREFTRFVTVYLELVAVALLGQTTPDNALSAATKVSDTWVFKRIRREYALAELTRTSKWDALARLSDAIEVPALGEMARMLRLSEAKVAVRDQLRAACDKLRAQVATEDSRVATRVTGRMRLPIFLMMIPIFVLALTPAVLQLVTL
jgi:hypothetical protein